MAFCEKHQHAFVNVCSECVTDKRKAEAKLLAVEEARVIQNALCAMNVVGAPLFTTAIHRPAMKGAFASRRPAPETVVFTWEDHGDPNVNEVVIYTTEKVGAHIRTSFSTKDKIESYANQNEFFKAYGLND